MGEGRVLNLLRCLWKMNHGGLHRGRSRGETHLVKREKEKNRSGKRAGKYISLRTIKRSISLFEMCLDCETQCPKLDAMWLYQNKVVIKKKRDIKKKGEANIS